MEIAKKFFPDVECKWGESGLDEIIQDASIIGVAVVLAGQIQANLLSLCVFLGVYVCHCELCTYSKSVNGHIHIFRLAYKVLLIRFIWTI